MSGDYEVHVSPPVLLTHFDDVADIADANATPMLAWTYTRNAIMIHASDVAQFILSDKYMSKEARGELIRGWLILYNGPVHLRRPVGLTDADQLASNFNPETGFAEGSLWWFPDYAATDPWEVLATIGTVTFPFAHHLAPSRKNKVVDAFKEDIGKEDFDQAFAWLFTIAQTLWWMGSARGELVPHHWSYQPGLFSMNEKEQGMEGQDECESSSAQELVYAGEILHRYIDALKRKGY